MDGTGPRAIGVTRSRVLGFAGVAVIALGLAFVVVSALRPVAVSPLVLGCAFIISGSSNAFQGFGNRVDTDEAGVTGRRGRRFRRPNVRWTEVIKFERVGDGSLRRPATVLARTRDGRAVILLSYSIDRDAADEAVASLNARRTDVDGVDQAPPSGPIG